MASASSIEASQTPNIPTQSIPSLQLGSFSAGAKLDGSTNIGSARIASQRDSGRTGILSPPRQRPLPTAGAIRLSGYMSFKNDALISSSHALLCALTAANTRNTTHCKNLASGGVFFLRCLKHVAAIDESVSRSRGIRTQRASFTATVHLQLLWPAVAASMKQPVPASVTRGHAGLHTRFAHLQVWRPPVHACALTRRAPLVPPSSGPACGAGGPRGGRAGEAPPAAPR